MCEQLRNKEKFGAWVKAVAGNNKEGKYFLKSDIESATEGLIKFHENIIEESIKELETEELGHAGKVGLFITIREERENIMVIEHWLEDAV